jgi:hypothetical protein
MIESEHEILEWLARNERKRAPLKAPDSGRKSRAGRFKVALHADIHLQLRSKPGWIDDARSNLFTSGSRSPHRLNMTSTRAMTPLAIDPFREVPIEDRIVIRIHRISNGPEHDSLARAQIERGLRSHIEGHQLIGSGRAPEDSV